MHLPEQNDYHTHDKHNLATLMCHGVRLENPRHQSAHHQQLLLQAVHGPRHPHDPYREHLQQQVQLLIAYVQMLWAFAAGEHHLHHD